MAADVPVSALSQNGWYSDDTRADGTGSQAANTNLVSTTLTGPPENGTGNPLHDADILGQIQFGQAPGTVPPATWTGAVNLNIGPSGSGKSQISHRKDDGFGHASAGIVLAPGFSVAYSWMGDGTASVSASFKIAIKTSEFGLAAVSPRTGENAWDKLLVFEPGNQNPGPNHISNGAWWSESTTFTTGRWWVVDRIPGGGATIGSPMPLSAMAASPAMVGSRPLSTVWGVITAPGSIITAVQFGIGSGNADGNVYVNQLETSFYRPGDRLIFGPPPPSLSLNPVSVCHTGGQVIVKIRMTDQADLIVGGQFFLEYDETRLDFVSASPGSRPFTVEVFESVNETAGTIDYAVGVLAPLPGVMADTDMVTLVFDPIGESCSMANLISFRAHTPATRLTNLFGDPIDQALNDLPAITVDTTDPVITCPPNIVVNADAGYCSAVVDLTSANVQEFNSNPTLGTLQAPGVWYTDRYAPFGFTSANFDGGNRLKHSIDASNCSPCRRGSFTGAFYDTQGRKYDTPDANRMSIDLYVPNAWASTGRRMAGFWGTAFNSLNAVSFFPIIEFSSNSEGSGLPRFRGWNGAGWTDMGLPTGFAYDNWYTLEIELDGGNVIYTVGDLSLTLNNNGSVEIGNVILQGHNNTAGVTYDIYWDDFTSGQGVFATDNCTAAPSLVGVRSDLAALNAPYLSGVTTVTWTATDGCGNSSQCLQTVTVSGTNEVVVDVELDGVINLPDASILTRCITFDFWTGGGLPTHSQSANINFEVTGGVAIGTATLLVPCNVGPYTCMAARDVRHTLRRTDESLIIVGTQYVGDFTGSEALVGGNLNDDEYIDILDFGVFVGQFGPGYGTGNTPCGPITPHADINGDAVVNTLDFSFIQINFLQFREAQCMPMAAGAGPVTQISTKELIQRGMRDLVRADLNRDGWLDTVDVQVFMTGGTGGPQR